MDVQGLHKALSKTGSHCAASDGYFAGSGASYHIIEKVLFRSRENRTHSGHVFVVKFHRHVEDIGIRHAYIKRGTPELNGKAE